MLEAPAPQLVANASTQGVAPCKDVLPIHPRAEAEAYARVLESIVVHREPSDLRVEVDAEFELVIIAPREAHRQLPDSQPCC